MGTSLKMLSEARGSAAGDRHGRRKFVRIRCDEIPSAVATQRNARKVFAVNVDAVLVFQRSR